MFYRLPVPLLSCPSPSYTCSTASSSCTCGFAAAARLANSSPPFSCHSINLRKAPSSLLLSSRYVPVSATRPSAPRQMITSLRWIVDSLWAMLMVVLLLASSVPSAWLTSVSDSASSADVASSRIRMSGFLSRARAIAIRCFWPPESCVPRLPTWVSRPSGWERVSYLVR